MEVQRDKDALIKETEAEKFAKLKRDKNEQFKDKLARYKTQTKKLSVMYEQERQELKKQRRLEEELHDDHKFLENQHGKMQTIRGQLVKAIQNARV